MHPVASGELQPFIQVLEESGSGPTVTYALAYYYSAVKSLIVTDLRGLAGLGLRVRILNTSFSS